MASSFSLSGSSAGLPLATGRDVDDVLALARREPTLLRAVDVLPLADAQVAHDRLRMGQTRGRIVLTT